MNKNQQQQYPPAISIMMGMLVNLFLGQIRKHKGVVVVACSSIAATLLNGGRTAQLVFKQPLNLAHEEMPICNINKNNKRGRIMQQCKLLD